MAIDSSKECYFDIDIYNNCYTFVTNPLRANTCFALLKKIEIILENNLVFIDENDCPALMTETHVTFLKEKADEIVSYYSKAKVNFLFGNLFSQEDEIHETIKNIYTLAAASKLPCPDYMFDVITKTINDPLLLTDLMAFASTNYAGKDLRDQLTLEFATEAGFNGKDIFEARKYLKEFSYELKTLTINSLIPSKFLSFKQTDSKCLNERNTILNLKNATGIPIIIFDNRNFFLFGDKIFSLFNFKEKEIDSSRVIILDSIIFNALYHNRNNLLEYLSNNIKNKKIDFEAHIKHNYSKHLYNFTNFKGLKILLNNGNISTHKSLLKLMNWSNVYNIDLINFFLEHGANVNQSNSCGETPLHFLCMTNEKNDNIKPILQILLKYGADIKKIDDNGNTPYDYLKNGDPNGLASLVDPHTRYLNMTL